MSITPAAPVTPATTDLNAGVVHGINVGSAASAANFDAFLKHFAQTSANMVNPAGDELQRLQNKSQSVDEGDPAAADFDDGS